MVGGRGWERQNRGEAANIVTSSEANTVVVDWGWRFFLLPQPPNNPPPPPLLTVRWSIFLVTRAGTRARHFGSGTNLKREIWWQLRPQGLLLFQVRNFQYGCRCESLCSPQKNCKSMLFPTSLYPSGFLYNCKKVFVVI